MRRTEHFVKWVDKYEYPTVSTKLVFSWDNEKDKGNINVFDVEKSGLGLTKLFSKKITKCEFDWAKKQSGEYLAMMLMGDIA